MGHAKRKAKRREEFFRKHPLCIYCGAAATTFDHCPPRSFFANRHWPETYEFPACDSCNAATRMDEQALAAMIRSTLTESGRDSDRLEWEKLVQAVKNNQPELVAEWQAITRNEIRHGLRLAYGSDGDRRRQEGWGLMNLGPLSQAIITRFMMKLSKSLYYRHNGHVFDGVLYVHQINRLSRGTTPEYMNEILRMAPAVPAIERNKKSLFDQFLYRFNHSPEHRVMYAVVQFGPQFIFQLIAVSREMDVQLAAAVPRDSAAPPLPFRHECFLTQDVGAGRAA